MAIHLSYYYGEVVICAQVRWRQMAAETFETFVAPQNSLGRQKLSRSTIFAMGAFLTGDVVRT